MKLYTLKELKSANSSYSATYGMNETDLEIVNNLIPRIEQLRQGEIKVIDGDRAICITSEGKEISRRAYVELRNGIVVCTKPYAPFVNRDTLSTDASGGYWCSFTREEFSHTEYLGKQLASFTVWGRVGRIAHGAIDFQAEVNLWKVTSSKFY